MILLSRYIDNRVAVRERKRPLKNGQTGVIMYRVRPTNSAGLIFEQRALLADSARNLHVWQVPIRDSSRCGLDRTETTFRAKI